MNIFCRPFFSFITKGRGGQVIRTARGRDARRTRLRARANTSRPRVRPHLELARVEPGDADRRRGARTDGGRGARRVASTPRSLHGEADASSAAERDARARWGRVPRASGARRRRSRGSTRRRRSTTPSRRLTARCTAASSSSPTTCAPPLPARIWRGARCSNIFFSSRANERISSFHPAPAPRGLRTPTA